VAKNKLRKAKEESELREAERQKQQAESLYERQLELTRSLMEGVRDKHGGNSFMNRHYTCLKEYLDCQIAYHNECGNHLKELKQQLEQH